MLCVLILYISGGTYCLKSTQNDRFSEKLFMAILFTLRVFARNRRRNTFRISLWCLAWGSNPGFSSDKPTHYLLGHGDFVKSAARKLPKKCVYLFINYNTITNYIVIIYELSNFDYVLSIVSQTRVSGGNRTYGPNVDNPPHYSLDYEGTRRRRNIFSHFVLLEISDLGFWAVASRLISQYTVFMFT